MKSRICMAIMMLIAFSACTDSRDAANNAAAEAVMTVIRDAYVHGIHIDRDVDAVRKGFHHTFNMLILQDDQITEYPLDVWIQGIEASLETNPGPSEVKTTHKFSIVDATGSAAIARIEIFRDDVHIYTDYMSLYRFSDGWKIVSKIFYRHPDSAP